MSKEEFGEGLKKCGNCTFIMIGLETGESGTPHFQGYVYFKNAIKGESMRKYCDKAHWEFTKMGSKCNIEYCGKDDKEPYRFGADPKQGKRRDVDAIYDAVEAGMTMTEIVAMRPSAQGLRMLDTLAKISNVKRDWVPEVFWHWGASGSGKTHAAYEYFGERDHYVFGSTGVYWDGYTGEECVLLDDFEISMMGFKQLLRVLDRYDYRCPTKGGSRQLLARVIIITCCESPNVLYKDMSIPDRAQLLRRITQIKHFETQHKTQDTEVGW